MAVTLTWGIAAMECFARLGEYQDVVFKVSWTLTALNDENGVTATTQGVQNVPIDPEHPFTPYPDLTEAQVIGWVQTGLGTALVAQYEADVTNQVDPEIITPPLPWVPTPEPTPEPTPTPTPEPTTTPDPTPTPDPTTTPDPTPAPEPTPIPTVIDNGASGNDSLTANA